MAIQFSWLIAGVCCGGGALSSSLQDTVIGAYSIYSFKAWVGEAMNVPLLAERFQTVERDDYPRGLPPWCYKNPGIARLEHPEPHVHT